MERPKVTQEMIAQAAKKLAAKNGWDAEQADELAKAYRYPMGGYELAKELDSSYYWPITVMDVNALDCMDSDVRGLLKAACLAWAKEQNIQPPLPIGTMTTKGEITGIYEHDAAYYKVREPGETNDSRWLLVKFEDTRAA